MPSFSSWTAASMAGPTAMEWATRVTSVPAYEWEHAIKSRNIKLKKKKKRKGNSVDHEHILQSIAGANHIHTLALDLSFADWDNKVLGQSLLRDVKGYTVHKLILQHDYRIRIANRRLHQTPCILGRPRGQHLYREGKMDEMQKTTKRFLKNDKLEEDWISVNQSSEKEREGWKKRQGGYAWY